MGIEKIEEFIRQFNLGFEADRLFREQDENRNKIKEYEYELNVMKIEYHMRALIVDVLLAICLCVIIHIENLDQFKYNILICRSIAVILTIIGLALIVRYEYKLILLKKKINAEIHSINQNITDTAIRLKNAYNMTNQVIPFKLSRNAYSIRDIILRGTANNIGDAILIYSKFGDK